MGNPSPPSGLEDPNLALEKIIYDPPQQNFHSKALPRYQLASVSKGYVYRSVDPPILGDASRRLKKISPETATLNPPKKKNRSLPPLGRCFVDGISVASIEEGDDLKKQKKSLQEILDFVKNAYNPEKIPNEGTNPPPSKDSITITRGDQTVGNGGVPLAGGINITYFPTKNPNQRVKIQINGLTDAGILEQEDGFFVHLLDYRIPATKQEEVEHAAKYKTIRVPSDGPGYCRECRCFVGRERDTRRHILSSHIGVKYACDAPSCNRRYSRKTDLNAHKKKEHGG